MSISSEILVSLRRDRGWSQQKLSTMSGISERTIQRAEKDGACSLETKLALSSVFEITPTELSSSNQQEQSPQTITYITDWAGAFGLLILGLLAPAIMLLTSTNGKWELASAMTVWCLTIIFAIMNYGARETYRFFDNTSWIVKYPSYVPDLNKLILLGQSVINSAYIIGVIAVLVSALSIAVHAPEMLNDLTSYLTIIIRPLVYAILLIEFWIRPYKKKMERMLADQLKIVS